MVILLTRLLVIGLDLGELDLHVVVADGQRVFKCSRVGI